MHNYDILANPEYAEKFHYIPCVYPNRDEYVISRYKDTEMRTHCVDLVRIVINLPYLKKEKAKKMEFNPEYIEREFQEKQKNDKEPKDKRPLSIMDGLAKE